MDTDPTVLILDDDESFVTALDRLLRAEGFHTRTWTSPGKFLAEHDPDAPGCLLTDLIMPEMDGLELQSALLAARCIRAIVFLTGYGDVSTTVTGMRAGAVSFLSKPVRRSELVVAVREALEKDAAARAAEMRRRRVASLLDSLTPRERQVLELVSLGRLNKQIAGTLGAAEKTIKVHRGRLMRKMRVRSAAELVELLAHAGGAGAPSLPPFCPDHTRQRAHHWEYR
jgi:FixJ family two-component response regulator